MREKLKKTALEYRKRIRIWGNRYKNVQTILNVEKAPFGAVVTFTPAKATYYYIVILINIVPVLNYKYGSRAQFSDRFFFPFQTEEIFMYPFSFFSTKRRR